MNLLSLVAYINRLCCVLVAVKKGEALNGVQYGMERKKQERASNPQWRYLTSEKRKRRRRCDDKTCFAIPVTRISPLDFKWLGSLPASFSPSSHLVMAHTNWALRKFTLFHHAAHSYTQSRSINYEATLNKLKMMINMLYIHFLFFFSSHQHYHRLYHRVELGKNSENFAGDMREKRNDVFC